MATQITGSSVLICLLHRAKCLQLLRPLGIRLVRRTHRWEKYFSRRDHTFPIYLMLHLLVYIPQRTRGGWWERTTSDPKRHTRCQQSGTKAGELILRYQAGLGFCW